MSDRVTVLRDGKTVATHATAETSKNQVIAAMVGREVGNIFPEPDQVYGDVALSVKNLTVAIRYLEHVSVPSSWRASITAFRS